MKHLGCVSLLAYFLSPVKINAVPYLFQPFLLGKVYSSNFPRKGKDLTCFGFPVGAQQYLPLVFDEVTQLVVGDVLINCALFLPCCLTWLFL